MRTQAAERAAGTRLLEVACQHCTTKLFLQSFPAWSTQLLTIVKNHREEEQVLSMNDTVSWNALFSSNVHVHSRALRIAAALSLRGHRDP